MFAHRPLFSFSPLFFFSLSWNLSNITFHKLTLFAPLSFIFFLCIPSFPFLLHVPHHFFQFPLLPGLHATKEDKVVSIFFFVFLFVLWMWCLCHLKVKICWLCSNLELRFLLSVSSMLTSFPEMWCKILLSLVSFMLARLLIPKLKQKKGMKSQQV